jgi:nucleoid-associated protein YgaU
MQAFSRVTHGRSRPQQSSQIRLTQRGRRVVAALVVLPITAILAIGGAHRANAADQSQMTTVVVQPGESLWQIAAGIDPEADPRELIYQIEQINGLADASVAVGQQLVIPTVAG